MENRLWSEALYYNNWININVINFTFIANNNRIMLICKE